MPVTLIRTAVMVILVNRVIFLRMRMYAENNKDYKMKNEKRSLLELNELPPRAEELSHSEVRNVFGGCGQIGAHCNKDSDCCSGEICHKYNCIDSKDAKGGGGMF